jgi:hypothetical protein
MPSAPTKSRHDLRLTKSSSDVLFTAKSRDRSGGDGKHYLSPRPRRQATCLSVGACASPRGTGFNDEIAYPRASEFFRNDNGCDYQNRDALNEAHVLVFVFFFGPFFFFAITLLLD